MWILQNWTIWWGGGGGGGGISIHFKAFLKVKVKNIFGFAIISNFFGGYA